MKASDDNKDDSPLPLGFTRLAHLATGTNKTTYTSRQGKVTRNLFRMRKRKGHPDEDENASPNENSQANRGNKSQRLPTFSTKSKSTFGSVADHAPAALQQPRQKNQQKSALAVYEDPVEPAHEGASCAAAKIVQTKNPEPNAHASVIGGRSLSEPESGKEQLPRIDLTADLPIPCLEYHEPEPTESIVIPSPSAEVEHSDSDMSIAGDTLEYEHSHPASSTPQEESQPLTDYLQMTSPTLTPIVPATIPRTAEVESQPLTDYLQTTSPNLTPTVPSPIPLRAEESAAPTATQMTEPTSTSDDIDELTQLDSSPSIFENDSKSGDPAKGAYVWMRIEKEPLPHTEEPDELLAIWDSD
ncbi:hypothetical protein HK097_006119 [Rhizophlyctis rosea]|uniref:Uncharacterized protein n=1 Tax=Rhizophlyctis rosea TaxID=64517 RepID=A0AAD5SDI3_9FUNG|nr:hypothetical protein HK097_006119 [Rhizophlyctis rosea]